MKKYFFQYKTVLKKELIDALRDKKSIFAAFILPLILFPLLFMFMGNGASDVNTKAQYPTIAVFTVQSSEYLPVDMTAETELSNYIKNDIFKYAKSNKINIKYKNSTNISKDLIDGDITVALVIDENIKDIVEVQKQTANIILIYDDRSNTATLSANLISQLIDAFNTEKSGERVQESSPTLNIYPTLISSLSVSQAFPDLERSGTNSSMLQLLLPMLITLLISIGGANIAVDLVAGEKERNTFESLLSTSANRFSILSAKFTVVLIFSFATAFCEILAIGLSMLLGSEESSIFGAISSITLPFDATLLVIFNILMLCALFSSVLLVLTSTSNTVKEANAKTLWLTILPMIIAYSTIYLEVTDVALYTILFPIYNVLVSIKMLLAGVINYAYLWGSLGVNLLYASIAIYVTVKSFGKESLISK